MRIVGVAAIHAVLFAAALLYWQDADWMVRDEGTVPEALVRDSIARAQREGVGFAGGFMWLKEAGVPYRSQLGGHYQVLARLAPAAPEELPRFFAQWRLVAALLTAAAIALFTARVALDHGHLAGLAVLGAAATAPAIRWLSFNLYWQLWLLFAPFAVAWAFHDRLVARRFGLATALAVYAALAFAKLAGGYEFVTSLGLSVGTAVAYRELAAGATQRRALVRAALATGASVAGFALAAVAHFLQARAATHDTMQAFEAIYGPAHYRTVGDALGRAVPWSEDARTLLSYTRQRAMLGIPQYGWYAAGLACAIAAALRLVVGDARRALLWALGLGLASTLSWHVGAVGHMRYHQSIDGITHFLPYDLVAAAMVAAIATRAAADGVRRVIARGRAVAFPPG
jgi:hypothetical protein